jgi:hypothetical protein
LLVVIAAASVVGAFAFSLILRIRRRALSRAFASLVTHLNGRLALIPSVLASVQGVMAYETKPLVRIQKYAARLTAETLSVKECAEIDEDCTKVLQVFFLRTESYDSLHTKADFLAARAALDQAEVALGAARRGHNEAAERYNASLRPFARLLGRESAPLIPIPDIPKKYLDISDFFRRS